MYEEQKQHNRKVGLFIGLFLLLYIVATIVFIIAY